MESIYTLNKIVILYFLHKLNVFYIEEILFDKNSFKAYFY